MSESTLPRSAGIDMLRGASILLVVVHHLGLRIPLHKTQAASVLPIPLLKGLVYNGYEAVFIFFVISGFLITRHTLRRDGTLGAIDWRAFYARRAARILPCLLALVAVLLILHALAVPNYVIQRSGQSALGATASALTFTLNLYEGRTGWLPGGWDVLWSLSIEEVFYAAFPLVCMSLGRTRWLVPLLGVLVVSVPFTRAAIVGNEIWQEKAYLPGMGAIAAGVLAALAAARWPDDQRAGSSVVPWRRRALAFSGLAATGVVMFCGAPLWHAIGEGYLLVLVLGAVCLVLASSEGGQSWRGFGWLGAMGRASYEIYLTHMFVVFTLVGLARLSATDQAWGWIWYPPVVLLSWALGRLVASGFSEPANRWLRSRLNARRVAIRATV